MGEEEALLENARTIYDHIVSHPGSHLRRISREVNIHLSTARYHLDHLERVGLITSRQETNTKVYFAAGALDAEDKIITPLLQQKRFRDIILLIILDPGSTHSEISARLSIKPPTLSKYVSMLEQRKIVYHEQSGREKRYYVSEERRLLGLMMRFKKSFWDPFVDNILEIVYER